MIDHQGHILVVDDHKPNRIKISFAVKKLGYTVDAAEDGRQALAMLREQPIDLVLLDIIMPELDGYQVLEAMKADNDLRHIPVVVISAEQEMDSVIKGIELGAEDYLPKSFDPVLLKARISACLEKKKLRDLEQTYLKGLERELDISRQIQASFLPETLPQLPGWEIAAHLQAAREVAGDFYDAFILAEEQKVGLVIGDVCDKGVGAALFMALFRSLLRATAGYMMAGFPLPITDPVAAESANWDGTALRDIVTLTNNYVVDTHDQTTVFTTLFFGLLNPATGDLWYINGGQEPPIILGPVGIRTRLKPTGPVVGVWSEADFEVHQVRLEPGEIRLAFTDGVMDALNPAGERYTEERLLALLEPPPTSAAALLDRILDNLQDYMAGANRFDDITVLAVGRAGP